MKLVLGDCLDKLKELEDNSVDAVVTDPPYGLEFMGKEWDSFKTGRIAKYKEGGSLDIDAINSRSGKGGAGPSYTKRAAKRCRNCGKQEWSGSPCKCDNPDFEIDNSTQLTFQEFNEAWARECYRVLKPGGHLLAFAGSRMYHRLAVGVEDAGFEIRDQIMWIYGSGFPKSHNIGKAVDKIQGNEREIVGENPNHRESEALFELGFQGGKGDGMITKGNSDWEGWGTALKPAHEPIVMARKPFKGNVAGNVLEWGTGGINIDGCRVGNERVSTHSNGSGNTGDKGIYGTFGNQQGSEEREGRFPANIIFECTCDNPKIVDDKYDIRTYNNYKNTFQSYEENDSVKGEYQIKDIETKAVIHTDPNCPCYILDQQSGTTKSSKRGAHNNKKTVGTNTYTPPQAMYSDENTYGDSGGASRFFYCPKASKKDREEGMNGLVKKANVFMSPDSRMDKDQYERTSPGMERFKTEPKSNFHPTVKPTDLMAYLIRLVTPKGGVVLDPFMGSGSTGKAAVREGMEFIGIEREGEYMEIAKQRIGYELDKIQLEESKRKFW